MLIVGALALVYAFCYASGGLSALGHLVDKTEAGPVSKFHATEEGKYDAMLFVDIQGFNNALMYCGIVMILLAVCLYITSCNKRRNYYVTNFVATGVCAGGNIIISIILMALNGVWMGRFMNVDFAAWEQFNKEGQLIYIDDDGTILDGYYDYTHYSESTVWFVLGFVIYTVIIIASVLLILNLVWKIKLMQGEKKLLNGAATVEGGAAV